MRSEILLVTLNSTYQHSSVGLRYLHANLQEFASRSEILELTINQHPRDMAEKILAKAPKLVGFGVYIWNTKITEEVIRILRAVNSDLLIVLADQRSVTRRRDSLLLSFAIMSFS
ncbi:MAG: cobalamin-dependent protein [Bdellovibrionales bacterium]|nr:cobalamin-dependent protein [Bdellovibrionales bacterium]